MTGEDPVEAKLRGSARFELCGRRGSGGMGVVYEVIDRERGARMALKMLHALRGDALLRLKREFRALADLQHPNLVTLGELLEERGEWFYTMELVEGIPFLEWVRPGSRQPESTESMAYGRTLDGESNALAGSAPEPVATTESLLDERRLRAALAQLGAGIDAMHGAGLVHRDLKPANVLVTPEGRVVILDFGLVADAGRAPDDSSVVGTASYMAPEQAAGLPVTAAADWYSVGVMLYEALTARLPFSGPPLEVLTAKQRWEPPPPRALAPDAPGDLDALAVDLLRTDPERRPGGREVLARLGVPAGARAAAAGSWPSLDAPFVGRERELDAIEAAFADSRRGAVTVLLDGPSGIGKSTVVREATARLTDAEPRLTVLAARCYERESVPYKAFDPLVDALAAHLRRLPREQAERVSPPAAPLLAHVFPVLRGVGGFPATPRPPLADALELRRRLLGAVRALFAQLAADRPLLLVVDDLQWADADSLALFQELLRAPEAPALLLVATLRDDAPAGVVEALPGDVRRLPLGPLSPQLAAELALRLTGGDARAAAEIAGESAGHPLFIDELARRGDGARGKPLDEALSARAARLDPASRRLLELCAVAAGPLRQSACARAAGLDPPEFLRALSTLRAARLCRTSGTRGSDVIETTHDRVREAVAARMPASLLGTRHAELALALEAEPQADAEALAVHWRAAGEPARAIEHILAAARRAQEALAYERAVRLYRLALALDAPAGAGLDSIHAAIGDSLVALGRGGEAADAYQLAEPGARRAEGLELLRRAAEQRLRAGQFDAGVTLLRALLEPMGLRLPATPRKALWSLLRGRARMWLRGLGWHERDSTQVSAETLTGVDLCWSAAIGLGLCDHIYGADFQTRHLRLALDAGEPYRVARALIIEAAFVSTAGMPAATRAHALLDQAEALARRTGQTHAIGMAMGVRAIIHFQVGDFPRALAIAEEAGVYLREQCTGVHWEVATVDFYRLMCESWMGRVRAIRGTYPALLREAIGRGDLFAEVYVRVALYFLYLADDDPDGLDENLDAAMARWSHQGFHIQHFLELFARCQGLLYRGDAEAAQARLEAAWPALGRSLLPRIPANRAVSNDLRARAALARARTLPAGAERRALLAMARKAASAMESTRLPFALAMAKMARAGADDLAGRAEAAARGYADTAEAFAALAMRTHAAAARFAAARAAPGDAEAAARWRAEAEALREEGVVKPECLAAMLSG